MKTFEKKLRTALKAGNCDWGVSEWIVSNVKHHSTELFRWGLVIGFVLATILNRLF